MNEKNGSDLEGSDQKLEFFSYSTIVVVQKKLYSTSEAHNC